MRGEGNLPIKKDAEEKTMVTTICYGEERVWEDRWEAIDFFAQGATACDGAEKERYTTILLKLLAGEERCSDR